MADVYSVKDKDTILGIEEDAETGYVSLTFESKDGTHTITVEAGDLARAVITASPTFTAGIGELAQKAILEFIRADEGSDQV